MMDTGRCDTKIRFDTRGYNSNMSGINTEQSNKSDAIKVENHGSSCNLDNIELPFTDGMYEAYQIQELMPDLEIIAVDPDCFYASSENENGYDDEDEYVDIENVQNFNESIMACDEIQPNTDSLDVITLNIDDNLLIDSPNDDILFSADSDDLDQFDLASYIVGESSSILLSPPVALSKQRESQKLSSARKRLMSISDFTNSIESESKTFTNSKSVQKTSANNRRKRKNISLEFIYTSSSSDDENDGETNDKLNVSGKFVNKHLNENASSKKRKEDDPMWSPLNGDLKHGKNNKKLTKQTSVTNPIIIKNETKPSKQQIRSGGGLRQLLKHQMMSNRPNKAKLMKTNSSASIPKSIQTPKPKTVGLGRGKDISITAKYYNCSESSDNCERDMSHTVRNLVGTNIVNDNSDDDSMNQPQKLANIEKDENDTIHPMINDKSTQPLPESKTNSKSRSDSRISIDSNSMDCSEFAKALEITTPTVAKAKTMKKRIDIEQQKRIVKSTILLQNPAKFDIMNGKPVINSSKPFRDLKTNQIVPMKSVPKEVEKPKIEQISETKTVIVKEEPKIKTEVENMSEESNTDSKKDAIDNCKTESNAKRKLNLEEYLKRKSLKRFNSTGSNLSYSSQSIQSMPTNNEQNNEKNRTDDNKKRISPENSMYEEIIIVSMGCNTDISVPGGSFIKESEIDNSKSSSPTILLSNIQKKVEKVNSSAETAIISSTSLLSSIQNVIIKKTCEQKKTKDDKDEPEHGENKVIMHLAKDRIRPTTVTVSIQTEPYFQFPPLKKLSPQTKKQLAPVSNKRFGSIPKDETANDAHYIKGSGYERRYYRSQKALSESSYYSDENQSLSERRSRYSDFYDLNGGERSKRSRSRRRSGRYNRHRTISRSLSESSDASTSSNESSSTSDSSSSSASSMSNVSSNRSFNSYGGSSSKSYYGEGNNQFYRIRTKSNNFRRNRSKPMGNRSKSPEERRIVYVGRIEEQTTKEDLKRKFSVYGTVKGVSIHYKEMNDWKYGFVTFERPSDAYHAIDDSKNNPQIQHYDISFGGRRAFCREKYFDLDNTGTSYSDTITILPQAKKPKEDSFDLLLRKMKEKLQETRK